jgi:16S rRNA (cytosine967-C5)-methyltransferase
MRAAARLAAAIEILDLWLGQEGPAEPVLAQWGRAHRFAGKQDRVAIADRVYAALRRRSSTAWLMGVMTGRALVLGTLALEDGLGAAAIAKLLDEGGPHGPPPLIAEERARLEAGPPPGASPSTLGDYPDWLHPALEAAFGSALANEMAALAARAPFDLRVNTLRATRAEARDALAAEGIVAEECPHSPMGLRLPAGTPIQRSRTYLAGLVEIQDEGSQLVSLLAGAEPGMTVVDLAAGAGGKSLALAALMGNQGRIIAADIDPLRLERLSPRAMRAGARIIETRVLRPWTGGPDPDFPDLGEGADLVLLDAPCSGSGTWRRAPDAKWRLTASQLAGLGRTQEDLLARAAGLVKTGGRLAYITCSILAAENGTPAGAFLSGREDFEAALPAAPFPCYAKALGLTLTPARTGTDGFFFALFRRKAGRVDGS